MGASVSGPGAVSAGADGFFHPATEAELVGLVQTAHREGRQLRVRGAAHSVSHAIYTDPLDGVENRVSHETPPPGDGINIMLDGYRGWRVADEGRRLVEVDAGLNLGEDPNDPTGTATVDAGMLSQLAAQQGWTLHDTGGITHQTVSGFTATGSAGGSVRVSCNDNLFGFRVIDGTGAVHVLTRDDPDPDPFFAMSPNLGLLGVVSTITLQCLDAFNISGQEATTTIEDCAVDVFGPGAAGRPTLVDFLQGAEFARLEWWPQRGADRILTWQAQSLPAEPGFVPAPYRRFGDDPEGTQYLISFLYTIIGNLDDLSGARAKLEDDLDGLDQVLRLLGEQEGLGEVGRILSDVVVAALRLGVDAALAFLEPFAPLIARELPGVFPALIDQFVGLDSAKRGPARGTPQSFRDVSWLGLPMDNAASDTIVPTEFTEIWIPLRRAPEAMGLLRAYFDEPADDQEALARTGTYAWELYAAKPNGFWLNPSYSDGADEWRDGAFRIDPYWFAENAADPVTTFFGPVWALLRDAGIPLRLHWGKFQPAVAPGDRTWVDLLRGHYPRWDDFLALRQERDPNNIFLTSYWRDRLGLWEAPAPVAQ
jgi:hypothetical protein